MLLPLLFLWTLGLFAPVAPDYPPGCVEYLRTCIKQLPSMELRGIPTTVEDLNTSCSAFTTGMNCVDNFTVNCMEKEDQKWVENAVAGAKATFQMLCQSKDFRNEYLFHADCFRVSRVNVAWGACAHRFISLVRKEMVRKNAMNEERVVELCCAKHGFLKCVHGSARHKCGTSSAKLLRSIAETLASVRVKNEVCNHVNVNLCSGAASLHSASLVALVAMAVLAVLAAQRAA